MKIAISGATGLIGSRVRAFLLDQGHSVTRIVRAAAEPGDVLWDPAASRIERDRLEGHDAVIHLAAENVGDGRWTAAKKKRIRDSRVQGTGLLSDSLAKLEQPPQTLLSASAIGYYGDHGDEPVDESSPPGKGFLADVCQEWEAALEPARKRAIRIVPMRQGVVLDPAGGALGKMLPPFRMGVGGRVSSGEQYMSWIAIDDLIAAMMHLLSTPTIDGPVVLSSPNAVTNREFTSAMGRVLRRPTVMPLPAFVARMAFGEMANEMMLSSTRANPSRLMQSGFHFRFPELEPALRHLLHHPPQVKTPSTTQPHAAK